MLLRRMMDHVKSQNWLAVFLDFVIVVVGVYIGIQLGNWNEASSNSQRKSYALDALQAEYELNIEVLADQLDRNAERNVRELIISEALTSGTLPEEDRDQFDIGLAQIMFFAGLPVRTSVYNALEQSGDLALIDDQDILISLNDFNSSLGWIESQRASFRNGISDMREEWDDYVFHVPTDDPRVTKVRYDFDSLAADPMAVSNMVSIVRMKHIFTGYIDPLLQEAISVCRRLAEETGRPCEVAST